MFAGMTKLFAYSQAWASMTHTTTSFTVPSEEIKDIRDVKEVRLRLKRKGDAEGLHITIADSVKKYIEELEIDGEYEIEDITIGTETMWPSW
jgi:hypothetical protein